MNEELPVCPVCTLFLRPGMSMDEHLTSHSKQKVIAALVRLSTTNDKPHPVNTHRDGPVNNQGWAVSQPQPIALNGAPPPGFPPVQTNHSFVYQQILSTSQVPANMLNVAPMGQQYVATVPTVFNPQLVCPPYIYQQQQQQVTLLITAIQS